MLDVISVVFTLETGNYNGYLIIEEIEVISFPFPIEASSTRPTDNQCCLQIDKVAFRSRYGPSTSCSITSKKASSV